VYGESCRRFVAKKICSFRKTFKTVAAVTRHSSIDSWNLKEYGFFKRLTPQQSTQKPISRLNNPDRIALYR
jgi:hypothetical protein